MLTVLICGAGVTVNNLFKRRRRKPVSINRLIAFGFFAIILFGTILLLMPFSSRDGNSCGLIKALFTATSSTCVTGLTLADTWAQWNGFGQFVILVLIQLGGLGFMSVASIVIFTFKKKASMREQLVMAQSINVESIADIRRIQKRVLLCGLTAEGLGAIVLTLRFWPEFGFFRAIKLGIFHSVSAFCNAGFDIMGFKAPDSSMCLYGTDPVVCITLALLIIAGGIGFLVWDEVIRIRSPKKWSIYTKLVLISTAVLLISGTLLFLITERNNPNTLSGMSISEKLITAFFQSTTTRTAGFAGIDQGALTDAGKAVTIFFMLIGGSSGSTAGGIKTVTFTVLILFLWSRARGRKTVSLFHRTVKYDDVLNALTVCGIMIFLSFIGGTLICATSSASFTDGLYESVSALATVGLSTGITRIMSLPAKLLMIVYMYFGRVGVLTISLGFLKIKENKEQFRYAQSNLLIG